MVQSCGGGGQVNNDINTVVDTSTELTLAEIAELEALRDEADARIAEIEAQSDEIDAISAVLVSRNRTIRTEHRIYRLSTIGHR